ncbi:MAG: DNA polymerase III subunit gamma/tau [Cyanobacteria bacterium P01_F01_bin.13]
MAYEPLHHKYRPQTFAQLVGQDAIAATLSNALKQNRIAPAYLFCGPRGTGKTSSARILAKSLNCLNSEAPTPEPCGQCQVCQEITVGVSLDIIEIDAASNTGVDNIRELIERAQFAPVQCRHKLYVLDEVHMLSTAAFNALLKTLEEPPPHVVFVLATTDPQRVLPTIISRCQRFDFRRIPLEPMVQHLDYIAQQESIAIAPDALQLVAQLSQGGLRDAESLLDQLGLLDGEITIEAVWDLVGAVSERDLLALVQAVSADNGAQVLVLARQLMDRGREPLMVLQSLVAFYRDLLIAKTAGERRDLVAITPPIWAEMVAFVQALPMSLLLSSQQHLRTAEVQVKNTTQPRLWLEIILMGLLPSTQGQSSSALGSVQATIATTQPPIVPIKSTKRSVQEKSPKVTPSVPSVETRQTTDKSSDVKLGKPAAVSPSSTEPAVPAVPAVPATVDASSEKAAVSKSSPSPEVVSDAPAMGSLSDIWAKIVAQLTPMGTQVLMRQHGQLVTCDGVEACVGITNDKLMRMAQDRLSNVETAFEKVFGHKLRVTMVVAMAKNGADRATTVSPIAMPPPAAPLNTASAPAMKTADVPTERHPPQAVPADKPSPTTPPVTPHAPPAEVSAEPSPWQAESDLDRSVKSFAQFFSGQIVDLDDVDDDPADVAKPSTEPGPDVPF